MNTTGKEIKTDDPFIKKHLDFIKFTEVLLGKRRLYISCQPMEEGSFCRENSNEWVKPISGLEEFINQREHNEKYKAYLAIREIFQPKKRKKTTNNGD
jgi:hypothetical protein